MLNTMKYWHDSNRTLTGVGQATSTRLAKPSNCNDSNICKSNFDRNNTKLTQDMTSKITPKEIDSLSTGISHAPSS